MLALVRVRGNMRGFTLVELMVVITIIAILAVLATPSITQAMANRRIRLAAFELQSSIAQARSYAATNNRQVEWWPAYTGGWNVAMGSRTSSISLPNSSDVSKTALADAKLSWYVVMAGYATGTSALAIADSTTNLYPVQVSLSDKTTITMTTTQTTTPALSAGIRFFPTGYLGNIPTSGTTASTLVNQPITFRICDNAVSGEQGYTVVLSPFGTSRSFSGGTTACP